jgi:hypothetical protein
MCDTQMTLLSSSRSAAQRQRPGGYTVGLIDAWGAGDVLTDALGRARACRFERGGSLSEQANDASADAKIRVKIVGCEAASTVLSRVRDKIRTACCPKGSFRQQAVTLGRLTPNRESGTLSQEV